MNVPDILDKAASTIEQNGWIQGDYWSPGADFKPAAACPVCVLGAIATSATGDPVGLERSPDAFAAAQALGRYLGRTDDDLREIQDLISAVAWDWNDLDERTAEQVTTAPAEPERTDDGTDRPVEQLDIFGALL